MNYVWRMFQKPPPNPETIYQFWKEGKGLDKTKEIIASCGPSKSFPDKFWWFDGKVNQYVDTLEEAKEKTAARLNLKLTTELKYGDKIKFADLVDVVFEVQTDNTSIATVLIVRRGHRHWFFSGLDAYHEIIP